MAEDDLDALLDKLERQAGKLSASPQSARLRDSDEFPPATGTVDRGARPGDTVGENYEVVEVVGESEASRVLLVKHRGVDRLFTMKLLPPGLARVPDRVSRFQEEARATSMIGHENIVFVTDFGRSSRFGHYFVMEHLEGVTLSDELAQRGALSLDTTLDVAVCAGSALAAAHELGVVHCDVCPQNLMSHERSGQTMWKLLDFGLSNRVVDPVARAVGYDDDPLYVAPEVALGAVVDPQADQFSLAAVLYHMLVGTPPWPDRTWTRATPERWTEPSPMPSEVRDDVSKFIDQVLLKALHPDPTQRHATVEKFVERFQRASGRSRRPTIPPIDIKDATRAMLGDAGAAVVTIGTSFDSEVSEVEVEPDSLDFPDPPSLEVTLDVLPNMRSKITMTFQHAQRLRREWRRNLVSGGLFVPTVKSMAPETPVTVALVFAPTEQDVSLPGRIIEYTQPDDSSPGGLAVQIDESHRDALHAFLDELDLGILSPTAIVRPVRRLDASAGLSPNEAFFMTRLTEPMNVGRLRAMFATLPFDLDDVVATLEEGGWIQVEGRSVPRGRVKSRPGIVVGDAPGPETERQEFLRATLERADYFRSQGNFLAEIETLELAAQRAKEASLYYRAGLTRIQFQNDVIGAHAALQRACELAPDDETYARALRELNRFV